MAAGDMFLEFSGGNSFKGELPDDKYKETIQILSYLAGRVERRFRRGRLRGRA